MTLSMEQIERLAIDRRLGELSDEAALLFDAYVAQNADAARSLADINETLSLAGAALLPATPFSDDPFPAPRFIRDGAPGFKFRRISDGLIGFAIAASLALVTWIGFGGSSTPPGALSGRTVTEAPSHESDTNSPGFWSLSSLRNDVAKRRTATGFPSSINWTGPVTRPRIGASS